MNLNANPLLQVSPYDADGGNLIGRDPRTVLAEDWAAAGTDPVVGMKAIRAKCIDCCGGNIGEVRKCVCSDCPLWPLRMGMVPKGFRSFRDQNNPHQDANSAEAELSEHEDAREVEAQQETPHGAENEGARP